MERHVAGLDAPKLVDVHVDPNDLVPDGCEARGGRQANVTRSDD
jgi:hypothetical protein